MEKDKVQYEENNDVQLAKLTYDSVKQNDLKVIFEILMVPPDNRTISDLDTLVKILIHIQPIKKFNNLSAIHYICKKMHLTKFKTKDIIASNRQQLDGLYIILNGRAAFYRKANQYYEENEIIFLNSGSCFGDLYNWKVNFMTISMEQTLIAVLSKNQIQKIPIQLCCEKKSMTDQIKRSRIFLNTCNPQKIQEASIYFTWSRVPLGTYLMRQSETPKALFYIYQGTVRKIFNMKGKQINVKKYSQGDYCPKKFGESLNYDLVADCSCEIIIIPHKALNIIGKEHLPAENEINEMAMINKFLTEKDEWTNYKNKLINNIKKEQYIVKEQSKIR